MRLIRWCSEECLFYSGTGKRACMPFALCYSLFAVRHSNNCMWPLSVVDHSAWLHVMFYRRWNLHTYHFNDHLANVRTVEWLNECSPYGNMLIWALIRFTILWRQKKNPFSSSISMRYTNDTPNTILTRFIHLHTAKMILIISFNAIYSHIVTLCECVMFAWRVLNKSTIICILCVPKVLKAHIFTKLLNILQ